MNRLPASLLALTLLCGCAVGPNYQRPPVAAPPEVRGQVGPAEAASYADEAWWEVFQDETLRGLIDEALRDGYDVRIATARVEQARANAGIARSEYFPQIDYSGQWSRGRQSGYSVGGGGTGDGYSVNLGLSWELDLWGRVRRSNEAALARYFSTEEARRAVLLSLVSEVATQYFQLRELDAELEISRRTRDAFQETFDLFNRRLEGGTASALETSSAEASLAKVAAAIPVIESQIVAQENAISLLLGRNPGPIPRGDALTDQTVPPEIPAGLPSDLLQRRPDLRRAEQELVAANADVGVAMANFFPTIGLTGAFGGLSPDVEHLFTVGKAWSIAAGLVGPLFQGGRLKNNYDARVAQWEETKLDYEQTVTSAFGEVSTLLVAHEKLAEAEKQQARAVAANQQAVELSNTRYLAGFASYLDLLLAKQQLFPAEIALAQTELARLVNFVSLYKALGGGWKLEDPAWSRPSSASAPTPAKN